MSDEDDNERSIIIPFPFGQPTPEQIAQMEAQAEEFMMTVSEFLRGLDSEQLIAFIRINASAINSPSTEQTLSYWNGMAAGFLDAKFDTCSHCMKPNHGAPSDLSSLDDHKPKEA